MDEPLRVAPGLVIPADELRWRFDTSGGPGGQHANKSSTRVELAFDLAASPAVPEPLRAVLLERLATRLPAGVLHLVVDESRSQWRNRQIARRRLAALLEEALRPRRSRRPTRPTAASRLRRLADKRQRGEAKRHRRPPDPTPTKRTDPPPQSTVRPRASAPTYRVQNTRFRLAPSRSTRS